MLQMCYKLFHLLQMLSSVTGVLQTISSVLSSVGHLRPVCVCEFNLGSLHMIMNIIAGLCYLAVSINHISEHA